MESSPWEIIVLKPTPVFFAFLASQLPQSDLPPPELLHVDNTAYAIRRQATDEATLDEIEKHFVRMFRYEISRWLGAEARNPIEGSFLDFLCCFKFELHTHLVVMEPSFNQGKQLIRIKPRSILLQWMKSIVQGNEDLVNVLEHVTLTRLAENATVLIKNFTDLKTIKPFLKAYYSLLFEAEMQRMGSDPAQWPCIDSYATFCRYFVIEMHTRLIHLHEGE